MDDVGGSRASQSRLHHSNSISSFLAYMHRRLSFGEHDSRDDQPEDQDLNTREDGSGVFEGLSVAEDGTNDLGYQLNESPSLHRAGLLQTKSYNVQSSMMPSISTPDSHFPHTPDSIRAATLQLSNMPFGVGSYRSLQADIPPTITEQSETATGGFIFPQATAPIETSSTSDLGLNLEPDQTSFVSRSLASSFLRDIPSSSNSASGSVSGSGLGSSIATLPPPSSELSDGNERERRKPSGISLLKPPSSSTSSRSSSLSSRSGKAQGQVDTPTQQSGLATDSTPTETPIGTPRPSNAGLLPLGQALPTPNRVHWRSPPSLARQLGPSPSHSFSTLPSNTQVLDENTPLLHTRHHLMSSNTQQQLARTEFHSSLFKHGNHANGNSHDHEATFLSDEEEGWGPRTFFENRNHGSQLNGGKMLFNFSMTQLKTKIQREVKQTPEHARKAVKAIPAVLLGCLLNILDGVSYGMIIFPATGVFADLGPMGVSMFFVTTVIAQLVYTFGGSGFAGANGSMMIEVVPFFHILATSIAAQIGEDQPLAVIATTLVAYTFSSILTGISFFLLGALKLGVVIGFFPRHILVGCIGGVGAFLMETGLTVSMRISEDEFEMTWETFEFMFFNVHNLILWTLPLGLAILLRLITHKYHHQLIFPIYFVIIPVVFYIVVFAAGLDLVNLRRSGWIFDMGTSAGEPWYKFYTYFDLKLIHFNALWATMPTQFALLFFNILHPPLNVPALAVSLNEDVDTNKELVAHGYSNLLSGFLGTVPNYLVYVNTLLFYRVGGDNRISGFMLAIATAILLVIGPRPIAFIPVTLVGALIFVLGIDLMKEALWDNRHRVTWSEYITIISIMICMTVWDFVIGVLFGIIVCCFFFVVQNSQLRSIRAMYTGDLAMSAVRRPSLQRAYIREVSKQTTIVRLQGFLFFGTITYVEESIRSLLEAPYWQHHPIQFLVLDLSLVAGIDMSAAEAFVRIQRLLAIKRVTLVLCGFTIDSPIAKALRSVEVLDANGVELFSTFNDAMEWTENAYLRAWFRAQKVEMPAPLSVPGRPNSDIEYSHLVGSFVRSPRRSHLRDAGERTIANELSSEFPRDFNAEPINTLRKAFSSYGDIDAVLFQPIGGYLERITAPTGHVLWRQGDPSDGLYIIESGVLRASYRFQNAEQHFEESMVAGTVAGEMSALSDSPRNATVVVEHPAVLWKFSNENIQRLQVEEPGLARIFIQLVLKAAKIDYDILLSAIASRQ